MPYMTPALFWNMIGDQLNAARTATTAQDIIEIFHGNDDMKCGNAAAFFAGSGGNEQLSEALTDAGWHIDWIEYPYHYTATPPNAGDSITYIEGDIYLNN